MFGVRLRGPFWIIDEPTDIAACLHALHSLLPASSTLVLEECAMDEQVEQMLRPHTVTASLRVARDTILPRSRQHHIAATKESMQLLADLAEICPPPAPRLCDHIKAYRDDKVILEWHDAFTGNPIRIASEVPEESVREFASRFGVSFSQSDP